MAENQNDHRNQQSDSKSHQEQTQDGKKKEETNPNNPKANQSNQQGSQQGNKQNQGSPSIKGETNTYVQDEEEETADAATSEKTGNQNTKKGNM